jgi:hypothetical protein
MRSCLWTKSVSKDKEYRSLRIMYGICINAMPLPVYIDRHHCYNKEIVSTGTNLNFCYSYSFFTFCFYFYSLQEVYFVDTSPLVCLYVIFLVIKHLGINNRNSILQIKVMP